MIVVVPRLVAQLTRGDAPPTGEVWADTALTLPDTDDTRYRNLFTGEQIGVRDGSLPLAEILATFPVALLQRETDRNTTQE